MPTFKNTIFKPGKICQKFVTFYVKCENRAELPQNLKSEGKCFEILGDREKGD